MTAVLRWVPMHILIADYPQLRLIAWNRRADARVEEAEALALYESNWRHVDVEGLDVRERELIDHLVRTVGGGVLNA